MDIEIARTFLAVIETRNFKRAADLLNVTQSTVSMRIKALEGILGRSVFVRNRSGTSLTAAGRQFHRYAGSLVQTWNQAQHETSLPSHFEGLLSVGGQLTLWDRLLLRWIPWMQNAMPDIAIRAEAGLSDGLMRQLMDGLLDIAVMYTPQSRPGFVIEELLVERLVFVSTDRDTREPGQMGFVEVNWGPEFQQSYLAAFPDQQMPYLTISHGPNALSHIQNHGGSGYFPLRMVRSLLENGSLHHVDGTPEFARPVQMVYPADKDDTRFMTALQGLRYVASMEAED